MNGKSGNHESSKWSTKGKEQNKSASTLECLARCGFFGLVNFDGYCSICFRKQCTDKTLSKISQKSCFKVNHPATSGGQTITSTMTTLSNSTVKMNLQAKANLFAPGLTLEEEAADLSSDIDSDLNDDDALRAYDPDSHDTDDSDDPFDLNDESDSELDSTANFTDEMLEDMLDQADIKDFLLKLNTKSVKDNTGMTKLSNAASPSSKAPTDKKSCSFKMKIHKSCAAKKTIDLRIVKKTCHSAPSKPHSKKRCNLPQCRRSIAVICFDCRCGGQYCTKHRLAKEHNCSFDYRVHGIEELDKANPKITADKIKKFS